MFSLFLCFSCSTVQYCLKQTDANQGVECPDTIPEENVLESFSEIMQSYLVKDDIKIYVVPASTQVEVSTEDIPNGKLMKNIEFEGVTTDAQIRFNVGNAQYQFNNLLFTSIAVFFYKATGNSSIKANLITVNNVAFSGSMNINSNVVESDGRSLFGFPKAHVNTYRINVNTAAQLPIQSYSIESYDGLKLAFVFNGFYSATKATIEGSKLSLEFSTKATITIPNGGYAFNNAKGQELTVIYEKVTTKDSTHSINLQGNSVLNLYTYTAGESSDDANTFNIKCSETAKINFITGSSLVSSLEVSGGTTTLAGINTQQKIKKVSINKKGKLFFNNNAKNSYDITTLQFSDEPYVAAASPLDLKITDFTVGNCSQATGFGQNINFHVLNSFKADDINFKLPSLEFNDDCQVTFTVDMDPKEGIYVDESFVPPKKPIKIGVRGISNTPKDSVARQLVENPTYMFCSRNLNCDDLSYTISSALISGFTKEKDLTKRVCQKPDQNSKYTCFGFQLSDYPNQVYTTLYYPASTASKEVEVLQIDKPIINQIHPEKAKELLIVVDAKLTDSQSIDFTGFKPKNPLNVSINRWSWTPSKVNVAFPASTEGMFDTISFNAGDITLKPANGASSTIIAANSLAITMDSFLTIANGVSLSRVKVGEISFDAILNHDFDYSVFNNVIFSFYTKKLSKIVYNDDGWQLTVSSTEFNLPYKQSTGVAFRFPSNEITFVRNSNNYHPVGSISYLPLNAKFDDSWDASSKIALVMQNDKSVSLSTSSRRVPIKFFGNAQMQIKSSPEVLSIPDQTLTGLRMSSSCSVDVQLDNVVISGTGGTIELNPSSAKAETNLNINNITLNEGVHAIVENAKLSGYVIIENNAQFEEWECALSYARFIVKGNVPKGLGQIIAKMPMDQRPLSVVVEYNAVGRCDNTTFKLIDITGTKRIANWSNVISFKPATSDSDDMAVNLTYIGEDTYIHFTGGRDPESQKQGLSTGAKVGISISCIVVALIIIAIVAFVLYKKGIACGCLKNIFKFRSVLDYSSELSAASEKAMISDTMA